MVTIILLSRSVPCTVNKDMRGGVIVHGCLPHIQLAQNKQEVIACTVPLA